MTRKKIKYNLVNNLSFLVLLNKKMSKLEQAIDLAKKLHKWQKRKDGTDYIAHPLAVMELLKKYDFPEDALIAAVLHDVCEDTEFCSLEINELFGTRVGFIVTALSKNQKPKNNEELKREYKERESIAKISNLENYKDFDGYIDFRFHLYLNRLYTWIIAEPRILFIKIADQMHNISDMTSFSKEKKLRKIQEAEEYYLPIYKKSKPIFDMSKKTFDKYNLFIELLTKKIEDTKKNV